MKLAIFCFGSNLAGIHGAGAALYAKKVHGAIYGVGVGLQGTSYAIPTKDHHIKTLPLSAIKEYVDQFIRYATDNSDMGFNMTRIGCGLAGYKDKDIAPMFTDAPMNVRLPIEWKSILGDGHDYIDWHFD